MRKFFLAALFLLPVMILFPHLDQFAFQPGAIFSDMIVSHYPNGLFLQRSIHLWQTIPLWSSAILSGYPFAANPLSGLYYPPGWLAFLFTLPLGFNLVILLHLLWGGLGMYRFLRAEGLAEGAALLGSLTFEAMPKLYSHLAAGHLTLIYAVVWTPWLLLAERRTFQAGRMRWVLPGTVLGMIALADVRWAAYAGLLWLAYGLYTRVSLARMHAVQISWRTLVGGWFSFHLVNILFAALIAAPLLLPLAQYTRLATRSLLTAQDSLTLSLPPGQFVGLIYPNIGGPAEWILYPGAVIFGLVLYALCTATIRRQTGFWFGVIGVTLLFAMGSFLPPLAWIVRLPGLDLLRVPPRVLFLTGFGFAVVAGWSLQALVQTIEGPELPGKRSWSGLILFTAASFSAMLALAAWFMLDRPLLRIQFPWGAIFLVLVVMLIVLARARRISTASLKVMLLSAALIDLVGVNGLSLEFRPVKEVMAQGQLAAEYITGREKGQAFRVYSPSYSIPQQTAAANHLELADGVDPLQLTSYARFMQSATGVQNNAYSITLPPFANGNPATDNQAVQPNAEKLGLLNVKYIVSEFALPENDLNLLARFGQTRVYENLRVLPRAWVQPAEAPPGKGIHSVHNLEEQPNKTVVKASGPGLLVLSELAYPGWLASVDGKSAPIETVSGLFRGVRLDQGEHEVMFSFRPIPLYIGCALAGLTWISLIVIAVYRRR